MLKSAIIAGIFLCIGFNAVFASSQQSFDGATKNISFYDGGLMYTVKTNAKTVREFLDQQNIKFDDKDQISPSLDQKIFDGTKIIIERAKKITIKEGGKTNSFVTFQNTIEQAIWENKNIQLDEDDVTMPARNLPVKDEMVISVTHVLIKEEIKQLDIDFKTVTNEDDSLGWRVKKVTQAGQKGIKEVKYKIVYNDGKEISRKILESNIIKDPVSEIVTQGTYVKTGKISTGQASWYAFTGTLAAANPWLPLGSYVKVTNQDNGKTVIVKINDRGPFGKGRIIDLDKVAFEKIASLGAGIVNVKMEVILN